jgi:hypothetical protein
MRRAGTAALVFALGFLALAAIVDALVPRDGGSSAPRARTDAHPDGDVDRAALRSAGIQGTLFYTDSAQCTLRAVDLPAVRAAWAPDWDTCAFALGPGAEVAAEGTVFRRDGRVAAAEWNGGVDVFAVAGSRGSHVPGARAPAFTPDGTLTLVEGGRLLSLARCPSFPPAGALARCAKVLTTEDDLTRLVGSGHGTAPRLAIEAVAWLAEARFVALVDAGSEELIVHMVVRPGEPRADVWLAADSIRDLTPSPGGRFLFALSTRAKLVVFDEGGRMLSFGGAAIRAAAWSPDERWIAILAGDAVTFVRPDSVSERVGPLRVAARDLAWD